MLKQVYTILLVACAYMAAAQQPVLQNHFTNQLNKLPHQLQQEQNERSSTWRVSHYISYDGVNNLWVPSDSNKHVYPDPTSLHETEYHYCSWNVPQQVYVNNTHTLVQRNGTNAITERIYLVWDGTQWNNSQKQTYTYDGAGNNTENSRFSWFAGNWVELSREVNTFNAQGYGINYLSMDTVGGVLTNNQQTITQRDGTNRVTQNTYQNWVAGAWKNSQRYNYYYTGSSTKTDSIFRYNWNGTSWTYYSKEINTYGLGGLLSQELTYYYNSGNWVNGRKETSAYNTNGDRTELSRYQWNSTQWEYSDKYLTTYNLANQFVEEIRMDWNSTTQQLLNDTRTTVTYTANGDYELYDYFGWANSAWDKINRYHYFYEEVQTSGVNNLSNTTTAKAYPNPFTVNTIIEFTAATLNPAEISIADINGRTVYARTMYAQQGNNNFLWNAEDANGNALPAGMYIVQIKQNGNSTFSKLIKQ